MRKHRLLTGICLLAISVAAWGARPKAKHVVFIGIDGMASWCVEKAGDIPTLQSMMDGGSYTLRKRSVFPTASAINWGSIFMGVPTEMHGYNKWNSRKSAITPVETGRNGMPTTVFTLLQEQRPGALSGAQYNWNGIGYVIDTLAAGYHYFDPTIKKDGYTASAYTARATEWFLGNRPAFFFLYFDDLDAAGHKHGYGSPEYLAKLSELDRCIGQFMEALRQAGLLDDTLFVITSDHGGINKDHGKLSIEELESPFIVYGRKVKALGAFSDSMMQYDVAANLSYVLGLEIPAHWRGRPLKKLFK